MQQDFHYYATYCAAILAGYTHEESQKICYSAELVDHCSRTFLKKLHAPDEAATTQLQLEMINANTSLVGLQDITRIWASFHFLPRDLYADPGKGSRMYKNKYRLICGPNGDLILETIDLAKRTGTLTAVGLAMHIMADTWAHRYFAGTPSLVINNTDFYFYELKMNKEKDGYEELPITFSHNPSAADDPEINHFTNTIYQGSESSVMNLGHGRAGHLPDYSYIRYKYLPAWDDYREMIKDNPSDYYHAFCQMVYAMKYLRGESSHFDKGIYDWDSVMPYKERIMSILQKRQLDASDDWKQFAEELSGDEVFAFDLKRYEREYKDAAESEKTNTFLGSFFEAAVNQKRMVTYQIFHSGSLLAGFSVIQTKDVKRRIFQLFGKGDHK